MKTAIDLSDYFFRDSLFNLVELSLLAKMYNQHCTPRNLEAPVDKASLAQILLTMKASEKEGLLHVAICKADPIGFVWLYQEKLMALYVLQAHQGKQVEDRLRSRAFPN